jgi:hypothetical protein
MGSRLSVSYRSEDSLADATTLARELERTSSRGAVFLDHRSLEPYLGLQGHDGEAWRPW